MKTTVNPKTLLCERARLLRLSRSSFSPVYQSLRPRVERKSFYQLRTLLRPVVACVNTVQIAGLVAKANSLLVAVVHSATVNWRIYTGLVLWAITPLATVFYKLFDRKLDDGTYTVNNYFLFEAMGPHIAM